MRDENSLDELPDEEDDVSESPAPTGKRLSQADCNNFKALHDSGMTVRAIAEKTGWTAATVNSGLKRAVAVPEAPDTSTDEEETGTNESEDSEDSAFAPVDEKMKKLDSIMQELGVGPKVRVSVCKSVQDVPNYQTPDGLFNLLTSGWRGLQDGKKAKLICERWFGYQNQQPPIGSLRPQNPGFPNQPPQFYPQNQGNQQPQQYNNANYPQYYPQQIQYPGYLPYPQPPQTPQTPQITAADVAAQVQAAVEKAVSSNEKKWEERMKEQEAQKRYEELNKKFDALQEQLKHNTTQPTSNMMTREVPLLDENNKPILDPATNQPMYAKETVPIEKADPYASLAEAHREEMKEYKETFKDIMGQFRVPGGISTKEIELEKKASAQEVEIRLKEMENKLQMDLAKMKSEKEIQDAVAQVQANVGRPEMSDEVRLASQTITEQGRLLTTGVSNLHDTIKEIAGIFKLAIAPDATVKMSAQENQPRLPQWSDEEKAALIKEMDNQGAK